MCADLSQVSKCRKLHVGAMIVSNNRIISTGVNGTLSKHENCCDKFAHLNDQEFIEAHSGWSSRNEIHAEMNAIIFAAKNNIGIPKNSVLYCTHEPCDNCLKHIAMTGIKDIYYANKYHNNLTENIFKLNIKHIKINK